MGITLVVQVTQRPNQVLQSIMHIALAWESLATAGHLKPGVGILLGKAVPEYRPEQVHTHRVHTGLAPTAAGQAVT